MLDVDRFGNLGLNVAAADIAALGLGRGDQRRAPLRASRRTTPSSARPTRTRRRGELILYEDSYGAWAIAINGGNAAALTEAAPATRCGSARLAVRIEREPAGLAGALRPAPVLQRSTSGWRLRATVLTLSLR